MSYSKNAPLLICADMRSLDALRLRQEGKTYDAIAVKIGYANESAAWKAVARGRRALQAQIVAEAGTLRKAELAEINLLQRKYEAAYELSGGRKVKEFHQVGCDALSRSYDRTEEWDEVGNPAYLAGILSCIERRCKLLGLDAPTKGTQLNLDMGMLTDEQLNRIADGEDVFTVLATSGKGRDGAETPAPVGGGPAV